MHHGSLERLVRTEARCALACLHTSAHHHRSDKHIWHTKQPFQQTLRVLPALISIVFWLACARGLFLQFDSSTPRVLQQSDEPQYTNNRSHGCLEEQLVCVWCSLKCRCFISCCTCSAKRSLLDPGVNTRCTDAVQNENTVPPRVC